MLFGLQTMLVRETQLLSDEASCSGAGGGEAICKWAISDHGNSPGSEQGTVRGQGGRRTYLHRWLEKASLRWLFKLESRGGKEAAIERDRRAFPTEGTALKNKWSITKLGLMFWGSWIKVFGQCLLTLTFPLFPLLNCNVLLYRGTLELKRINSCSQSSIF